MYVEAPLEPYKSELERVDSIRWYDVTPSSTEPFYMYVCQETRPADRNWRAAFVDRNLVAVPPIRYDSDASFHVTFVGVGEDLKQLVDDPPDEIDVEIEAVGEYADRHGPITGALTPRQQEAIREPSRPDFIHILAKPESTTSRIGCIVHQVRRQNFYKKQKRRL